MTYKRVLEKCVSVVFPDDAHDDCEYHVSNGRGMCIYVDEYIRVDNEEGEEKLIPWTLETYIKLSSIKYASNACFYCVKKYTDKCLIKEPRTPIFVFFTNETSRGEYDGKEESALVESEESVVC